MAERSFQSTLMSCRATRSSYSKYFHGVPNSFTFSGDGKQLMFLSSGSLYSCMLQGAENEVTASPGNPGWKKLCASGFSRQLSRSEQLLRERMRATGSGITSYDYIQENDSIVVHGSQCVAVDRQSESCLVEFPELIGSIDHKLCPSSPTLLGCVYEGDVWVLDAKSGKKHQLTKTADDRLETKVTAGQPSFIIQEEFDRYTGYWWQPQTKDKEAYRILFEEVDEKDVGIVQTFNPSSQGIEKYSYPKAGQKNASTSLKLLEFKFSEDGELCLSTMALPWSLSELFPESSEYIVRVGWMEDGEHIWVQLLDRPQNLLKVVVIAVDSFTSDRDKAPLPYVLWEEHTDVWINVTDVFEFLPSSAPDASLQFLWCSESSGYRHLYLITATPPGESFSQVLKAQCSVQQLTTGNWVVFGSNVWVDVKHQVIFFEANVTSPLEKHLYGVSLNSGSLPCENPVQLTTAGYYHSVTVDVENHCFVTEYSNDCTSPSVAVYSIRFEPLSSELLQSIWTGPAPPSDYVPPLRFTVDTETGEVLHGEVYTPPMAQTGSKFPTILYVYGGPHIQLVTRAFNKQLPKIKEWTSNGYVVVVLDNRGSANRGVKFESYVKHIMGNVELKDQVAGLQKAISTFDFIDESRIAITGWSYGGYLSLLGIALYPQVFKVAISGAPVTDWFWYDTGYTERYLGVPPKDIPSYLQSSVLRVCDRFPNEPNRLLIIHGMNDENVLFTHTSLLCDRLVERGKPYQLQLYTGERHGLRSPTSMIHCDATVLTFLYKNL